MSDDAKRALEIARTKLANGDVDASRRFAGKAKSIARSGPVYVAAEHLLKEIEALEKDGGKKSSSKPQPVRTASNGPTASTSKVKEEPKARAFTPVQEKAVKRIRQCKPTAFYEILELERSCDDGAIKKSFRKLSLIVHPDKCGVPGADEAFKRACDDMQRLTHPVVMRSVEVLGDPDKRAHFDRHGTDPDDRNSRAAGPSFASAAGGRRAPPGASFGDDISPEDLFNMFFGGGMGGMNGGTYTTFGPGGIRLQSFPQGMPNMRRQPGPNGQERAAPAWVQLLPLIVLFGFSLLSALPSIFSSKPPPLPSYRFEQYPSANYVQPRQTRKHKVDYFVQPDKFAQSALWKEIATTYPVDAAQSLAFSPSKRMSELDRFERQVESSYAERIGELCRHEHSVRNAKIQANSGFLGIGRDAAELSKIYREPMPNCDRLRSLGYEIR